MEPDLAGVQELMARWAARPGRAVIFDFNGTLSSDEPILVEIFTELFAEHLGWAMTAEDYHSSLVGHSDREIVQMALARHDVDDPALVERLLVQRADRYRTKVAQHSPITPGTTALVERLDAAGVPMAIVTGAQRADVEAVLSNCPAGGWITQVVAEEDVDAGKPDPEGFLKGAALLGADPGDILVFEDSVPGVRGAQRAGMACVAVLGQEPNPQVVEISPLWVPSLDTGLLAGTDL